ncbi:MAG TPA: hypothetical protein VGL93_06740 [Streptosporangiaceae bacterium]
MSDDIVAAFRAHLRGDRQEWNRLNEALDRSPATTEPYFAFLTALFAMAVQRRFGNAPTDDEIIDFVADLRSREDVLADRLSADATERMITMIVRDDVMTDDIPRQQTIDIRMGVLTAIIRDEAPDATEIEDLLKGSRALADGLLS